MRKRWIAIIGGLLIAGVLAVASIGVALAMGANGGNGPFAARQNVTGQQAPYGPGWMMNDPEDAGYGHMGQNGMMNGYGPGMDQQRQASATPVAANTVVIRNLAFYPANLEVKAGTTVTWINESLGAHTVTFNDSSITSSGLLNHGDTFSYTFTKAGVYTYFCDLHEAMTGQVTVTA